MDLKEYILSGRLEDYILGSLPEKERQEVECLASIYPELQEELQTLQFAFENYVTSYEVVPPKNLKEKIVKNVRSENSKNRTKFDIQESEKQQQIKRKYQNIYPWLSMAASIALLISIAFNFHFSGKNDRLEARLDDLETRFTRLSDSYEETVAEKDKLAFKAKVLADPTYKIIPMQGVEKFPNTSAQVFWDTTTKDVYVGVDELPVPPQDKQYQLWAIVDGEAVDAGVFDVSEDTTGLQKMKNIQQADAFVVTLEKRGGVPVAEGDIYVMGEV